MSKELNEIFSNQFQEIVEDVLYYLEPQKVSFSFVHGPIFDVEVKDGAYFGNLGNDGEFFELNEESISWVKKTIELDYTMKKDEVNLIETKFNDWM